MRSEGKPNRADRGGKEARHHDPDQDIHVGEDGGELVTAVGADPHESAGAERQEAGVAGEQVEPDRRQGEDQERDHHRVNQEVVVGERHEAGDGDDDRQPDAVLQYREDRLVGDIIGFELSGLTVEHRPPLKSAR